MVSDAAHREVFAIIYALTIACIKSVGATAVFWSIITLAPCITGKRDGDLVALFKGLYPVAAVATVRIRANVQIVVIRPLTEAQISVHWTTGGVWITGVATAAIATAAIATAAVATAVVATAVYDEPHYQSNYE